MINRYREPHCVSLSNSTWAEAQKYATDSDTTVSRLIERSLKYYMKHNRADTVFTAPPPRNREALEDHGGTP